MEEKNLEVGENSFPMGSEATCLGHQWRQDLSSTSMVQDRIQRARKAFFQFGSAFAFQGKLSPISSSSIVETSILLYGVENWVMSVNSINMLERF